MSTQHRAKKRSQTPTRTITVNPNLLYAERTIWSQRFKAWKRYETQKPRLPREEDETQRWVDQSVNCPRSFNGFTGKHNYALFQTLENYLRAFESSKQVPDTLIIHGPSGSGKTSIAKVYVDNLLDEHGLTTSQSSRWVSFMDANKFLKDFNPLWNRINRFADPPLEKFLLCKYRLLVIDNADKIPPSNQQTLKKIMENYGEKLRYIFICHKPKSMVGYILSRSTSIKTKAIGEKDALIVVLSILNRSHVGYNRQGIHSVFKLNTDNSLSNIIDLIQKVFVKEQFVSAENVDKVLGKPVELPTVSAAQAILPLDRCSICTLVPPCKHITQDKLNANGLLRRKELPRYKDGAMTCPEFARKGFCTMFNRTGSCALDHPKSIHKILSETKRCAQCTIPWPCNHCAYSRDRDRLLELMNELEKRLVRFRQINVPDPPLSLIGHLVCTILPLNLALLQYLLVVNVLRE